jgi:hypothetical protein
MKQTPWTQSGAELEAVARARAGERARWADVLTSREAAGRLALACSLLADTSESAVKIRAVLHTAPVTSAADAARDTAAQVLQAQRKASGEYMPPLHGMAAKIVRAYRRAVGTTR